MLLPYIRTTLILTFLILLAGCQVLQKSTRYFQGPDLISVSGQNEQITEAMSLLEKGENSPATKLINEVISYNPQHKVALVLKNQLELSAAAFFKTNRFTTYQVKKGDSLGKIASVLLGDAIYFVSLAKLNDIRNPSLLQPDTTIKIPLIATSQIIIKEKRRSTANLQLLEEYLSNKEYFKGLHKANSLFILTKHFDNLYEKQQRLLAGLEQSITSSSAREKIIKQVTSLSMQSRNNSQKLIYSEFIKSNKKQLLLEQAKLLIDERKYLDAANTLIKYNKINSTAKKQKDYIQLEKKLVNKLHEQAIVFYRNHVLEKALNYWQLVLQLQPKNKLADKYILRTKKLINKLDQF